MIIHFSKNDNIADAVRAALSNADVRLCLRKAGQHLPELVVKPGDGPLMRLSFVLVRVDMQRLRAEILGWLCGWQAMEREDKVWNEGRGMWFIPPPYHSVQSLEDWITSGAKPHWMPPEFDFNNPVVRPLPFATADSRE